jgi:amino acid transporter
VVSTCFSFLGWIIAMALYCAGFAGYARALLPWHTPEWSGKAIGIGLIVAVVVVNMIGTKFVGKSEIFVITIELAILAAFVVLGLSHADPGLLADNGGHSWIGVLFAAGLLYVTYEGFGVVTNSAGDMRDPARELPRAMFLSLGIVIVVYILVSAVIVMTLTLPAMDANQGHVLSEAGQHILGRVGFVVIGVAALLATASGVNATMFGDANLAYMVSKSGELPANFARGVWRGGTGGLFIAAVITAGFVLFFPLAAVGQMASLAFLIVYGTVSLGHARCGSEPGAVRAATRLHHPHRACEHMDHAACRAGAELRVRGGVPQAHRSLAGAGVHGDLAVAFGKPALCPPGRCARQPGILNQLGQLRTADLA